MFGSAKDAPGAGPISALAKHIRSGVTGQESCANRLGRVLAASSEAADTQPDGLTDFHSTRLCDDGCARQDGALRAPPIHGPARDPGDPASWRPLEMGAPEAGCSAWNSKTRLLFCKCAAVGRETLFQGTDLSFFGQTRD